MAVDSPKRRHDDVEEIKTNLAAATVFTRDAGEGRNARRRIAGKVHRWNFGVRSRANKVAAQDRVCAFTISARRRMAACIYMKG